jgi:UDP:flavonoid glycosyltransferase YjiC (YdhE family)
MAELETVARALRSGIPMLVEPHSQDQLFDALLVVKGRLGATPSILSRWDREH